MRWSTLVHVAGIGCASSSPAAGSLGYIPGELVVVLEEGAEPPTSIDGIDCEPGVWGNARTLLLRCGPLERPEVTEDLARILSRRPGVRSAEPNMLREQID